LRQEAEGDRRLMCRGAEADLLLGFWCGMSAVYKVRRRLPYRLKVLDDAIRGQRTTHEALMIHEAKSAGVRTPPLYLVDPRLALIVMGWVRGERLKEAISTLSDHDLWRVFNDFGGIVGRLHASGIMHGDLTTSNAILGDGALTFIDFGLALRTLRLEDHAVDLRLVKETLTGAHSEIASEAFEAILEGYGGEVGQSRLVSVRKQVAEIERRGRYARID